MSAIAGKRICAAWHNFPLTLTLSHREREQIEHALASLPLPWERAGVRGDITHRFTPPPHSATIPALKLRDLPDRLTS
ncbi:hypothetical protein ENKO_14990 [Enterobacter kobei]|uniref:Uncharacterized protein n=1 Tax=Enterobacter kobei TaxID=208224 RepID=A0AA86IP01_9ENTR|nr:hypothetical protein ENKO_14990 [Enterobacter kobei]